MFLRRPYGNVCVCVLAGSAKLEIYSHSRGSSMSDKQVILLLFISRYMLAKFLRIRVIGVQWIGFLCTSSLFTAW